MGTALKLTAQDYLSLPEDGHRYQLIEGELYMSPSPTFWHQEFLGRLYVALRMFALHQNLGTVCMAPLDVHLDDENVFQPDVIYIAKNRENIIRDKGIFGAPDLCVEVLSPSSQKHDTLTKRAIYARNGVREYWIVDPDSKTVTVYQLAIDATKPFAELTEADTLASVELSGFAFALVELFKR